ncbi:hypothetical protein ACFYXF_30020 [Streptomyces sp. NPDC002680]|uniref:hypothetical protein n=1 Tax=Streptomyces sp. NPDC002680 TaxID=3364659 RepID=UPI003685E08F
MTTPAEYRRLFLQTDDQQTGDFQKAMEAHQAKAAAVRDNANAAIARISARKDLTLEAKRTAAARVYKPATEQIRAMLDQHIAKVSAHKQQLARKAFGYDNAADPATAMARRQARQQAAAVTDPEEAERLIRDANFSGDRELARAVAAASFERGWHSVVDVWNEDGSNDAFMRHVVDLVQMPDTNDPAWRMQTAVNYSGPMPGILDGLKDHEISRAAAADLDVYGDGPEAA